jgi:hypothetical protein
MKIATLFTVIVLASLLVFFGLAATAANRAVDREYALREQHTSSVVSTINQYNASTAPNRGASGATFTNVLLVVFALTGLFTAVGATVGKGGLNGLVRQLKSGRRSHRPVHTPAPVPVHTPLTMNDYPMREPVHALAASTTSTEEPDDNIQW